MKTMKRRFSVLGVVGFLFIFLSEPYSEAENTFSRINEFQSVQPSAASTVTVENIQAEADATLSVPIRVTQGTNIRAFSFELLFDSDRIEYVNLDLSGTETEQFATVVGTPFSDRVVISGFAGSAEAVAGDVVLLNVNFHVQSGFSGSITITPDNFLDDLAGASGTAGEITVVEAEPPTSTPTSTYTSTPTYTSTSTSTYTPTATYTNTPTLAPTVNLTIEAGKVEGIIGESISLPILVKEAAGIRAFSLEIQFEPNQLEYVEIEREGTATEIFSSVVGVPLSDKVVVSGFAGAASGISGDVVLFNIVFKIIASAPGFYPVTPANFVDDIENAEVTVGWVEGKEGALPTATATVFTPIPPSATPTPTSTPSRTYTPTPRGTPTPSQYQNQTVFIYDNAGDTAGDLTGQTDFDSIDNRNLTIAWNVEQGNATDWHIYIRKGFGGMKFLGRTADGTATHFDWFAGAEYLEKESIGGPDFNSVYFFRVIRIDGELGGDDFFSASAPVGFNAEGGNAVALDRPELPNVKAGKIAIYDDILGGDDLAPMGSAGSDTDPDGSRALHIAWNFGIDSSEVNEYHILISIDGEDFVFLGQTYTGDLNYFWWTGKSRFRTNPLYADGPQDGHTYQFKVILIPFRSNRINMKSGVLSYSVIEE